MLWVFIATICACPFVLFNIKINLPKKYTNKNGFFFLFFMLDVKVTHIIKVVNTFFFLLGKFNLLENLFEILFCREVIHVKPENKIRMWFSFEKLYVASKYEYLMHLLFGVFLSLLLTIALSQSFSRPHKY